MYTLATKFRVVVSMDIVRFKGGLGNQMFQYALMEALRRRGRQVRSNLGFYKVYIDDTMPFVLDQVFPNVVLEEINDEIFNAIDGKWKTIKKDVQLISSYWDNIKNVFFFVEQRDAYYDPRVFDTYESVYVGYWQTEKYFSDIKSQILYKFCFKSDDHQLLEYGDHISKEYYSIHVRQGDYLEAPELYGEICTKRYYADAMEYIRTRDKNAKFIVFSDEMNINKLSSLLGKENILYFHKEDFTGYEDWYDMYLMTRCKGNIIANSSFSWWGAWLNQYRNKIVIAPKVWIHGKDTADIWCDDWIRM